MTFFETSSLLLAFIAFGRWLEQLAKKQTSRSITKLSTHQAMEARLVLRDSPDAEKNHQERYSQTTCVLFMFIKFV